MAELKYSKYILKDAGENNLQTTLSAVRPAALKGLKDWGGIQHRINWKYISQPVLLEKEPHTHDFDEFLCFLGPDPLNSSDFGAEIEFSLGQEGEKHIITASSVICIPKGLIHCPLNFQKINKPIVFCNVYLAPEYTRKPVTI
jgi:hypothetical protein